MCYSVQEVRAGSQKKALALSGDGRVFQETKAGEERERSDVLARRAWVCQRLIDSRPHQSDVYDAFAMLKLSDADLQTLRDAVAAARTRPDLLGRIDALYADVRREIDLRKPRCDVSGRCCRFGEYGHRLFVTPLEIGAFLASLPEACASGAGSRASGVGSGDACPYQSGRLCTVHTIRPFGCRIFFCDPTATDWQHEQYERFHLRLRQLHEELAVPYLYVDWLEALRAIERTR
jgi:Fe-S-cluster containining protein